MENELKVIEKQLPSIKTNAEALKIYVKGLVEKYKDIVATEDSYKDLKKDRAKLNKLSKAIDDSRKTVKTELSKPITEFENEMKSIVSLVTETSNDLNTQILSFEQKVKDEKMESLKEYLREKVDEKDYPKEYIDKVLIDKQFCNISASLNSGKMSIDIQLNKLYELDQEKLKGIETIKTMCITLSSNLELPLDEERYLKMYDGTNLNDLIQKITFDSQRQFRIETETKEKLRLKVAEEERKKIEEENRQRETKLEKENIETIEPIKIEESKIEQVIVNGDITEIWKVTGTSDNIETLKEIAEQLNIVIKGA